jgi:hypothetical protein
LNTFNIYINIPDIPKRCGPRPADHRAGQCLNSLLTMFQLPFVEERGFALLKTKLEQKWLLPSQLQARAEL